MLSVWWVVAVLWITNSFQALESIYLLKVSVNKEADLKIAEKCHVPFNNAPSNSKQEEFIAKPTQSFFYKPSPLVVTPSFNYQKQTNFPVYLDKLEKMIGLYILMWNLTDMGHWFDSTSGCKNSRMILSIDSANPLKLKGLGREMKIFFEGL
jgi:hypothetical protein